MNHQTCLQSPRSLPELSKSRWLLTLAKTKLRLSLHATLPTCSGELCWRPVLSSPINDLDALYGYSAPAITDRFHDGDRIGGLPNKADYASRPNGAGGSNDLTVRALAALTEKYLDRWIAVGVFGDVTISSPSSMRQ